MVMPALGFGEKPWWKSIDYEGERIVLGFRTLDGVEGLNEAHRLEVEDGRVTWIRCYCFCPETLKAVGEDLGVKAIWRPFRGPGFPDFLKSLIGLPVRPKDWASRQ